MSNPNSLERWDELRRVIAMEIGADPDTWPEHGNAPLGISASYAIQKAEIERLTGWVHDLQSGMYINCVYCGHRYGPKSEVACTMQDALKAHVEMCPKHPLNDLRKAVSGAVAYLNEVLGATSGPPLRELIEEYAVAVGTCDMGGAQEQADARAAGDAALAAADALEADRGRLRERVRELEAQLAELRALVERDDAP